MNIRSTFYYSNINIYCIFKMEKFASINIIHSKDGVINNLNHNFISNSYPIIFYWNGEDDCIDTILSSENFKEKLKKMICTYSLYDNTSLYIVFVSDDENFKESVISLQDIIPLKELDEDQNFYFLYFINTLKELYKNVYKVNYDDVNKPDEFLEHYIEPSYEDIVKDIYDKIISGVKRDLQKETITNYIRKILTENTSLNTENINFIILKIEEITKEES